MTRWNDEESRRGPNGDWPAEFGGDWGSESSEPGSAPPPWGEEGPQAGRGPSADLPPNEWLRDVVCQRLTLHGRLDARGVSVTAETGEVTLSGTVGSRWAKREAERVADSVPGVRDVHNRLRIQRGGPDVATHMGAIED